MLSGMARKVTVSKANTLPIQFTMPYDICDNDPRVLESPVSDWIERLACNPEPISLTPTDSVPLEPLAYQHDPATGYPQDLLLDPEFGSYRTNVWQVEEPR